MSKTDFYKSQLQRLFPKGRLFSFFSGSNHNALVEGIAIELARIDDRAEDVIAESDPRTTEELIDEWEAMLGLPGECGSLAVTLQERRNQILSKLTLSGNQSKQFYVDIAVSLGYDIDVNDIIEFRPFSAGSPAGAPIANPDDWRHTFLINPQEFTVRYFKAGAGRAGDKILEFGDELFECLITEQKPAHALVLFRYGR